MSGWRTCPEPGCGKRVNGHRNYMQHLKTHPGFVERKELEWAKADLANVQKRLERDSQIRADYDRPDLSEATRALLRPYLVDNRNEIPARGDAFKNEIAYWEEKVRQALAALDAALKANPAKEVNND